MSVEESVCWGLRLECWALGAVRVMGNLSEPKLRPHIAHTHYAYMATQLAASPSPHTLDNVALSLCSSYWTRNTKEKETWSDE